MDAVTTVYCHICHIPREARPNHIPHTWHEMKISQPGKYIENDTTLESFVMCSACVRMLLWGFMIRQEVTKDNGDGQEPDYEHHCKKKTD